MYNTSRRLSGDLRITSFPRQTIINTLNTGQKLFFKINIYPEFRGPSLAIFK